MSKHFVSKKWIVLSRLKSYFKLQNSQKFIEFFIYFFHFRELYEASDNIMTHSNIIYILFRKLETYCHRVNIISKVRIHIIY